MADIESALRQFVRTRADGFCEYCRIPEQFMLAERSKARWSDSCRESRFVLRTLQPVKGSDIASIDAETGQLTPLSHPPRDRWEDHYLFSAGEILALSATGRVTIRLLRMNRPARIKERQLVISASRTKP
ncbi:MAG: HNH endonuclease [Acidobacteriota bacterium]|nr:HNH endonuclease [Acidobacteriota bacterium]